MKPDDKFPEEMLEDIREAAVKAQAATDALSGVISELIEAYPTHPKCREIIWWRHAAANFSGDAYLIADSAEELADAEDETAEGGQE